MAYTENRVLYFEIDGLATLPDGSTDCAGLKIGNVPIEFVYTASEDQKIRLAHELTGIDKNRIQPISEETYLNEYDDDEDDQ